MLGWFGPRCPLETGEKLWTELRMRWLGGRFGIDRLRSADVVVPEALQSETGPGQPADPGKVVLHICHALRLDPATFRLQVRSDTELPAVTDGDADAGVRTIVVAYASLFDPERLAASIARALSREVLRGEEHVSGRERDLEYLVDLLPVFVGLGVVAANATVREHVEMIALQHRRHLSRQGFLSSHMLGYALALFAYVRGESEPAWAGHLRPDAAEPFRQGLRYLMKTGDSLFRPDATSPPEHPPREREIVAALASKSPTVRASALLDIAALDPPPGSLLEKVVAGLRDRDDGVQVEAARVLPYFGETAGSAVPELIRCLGSHSAELRRYATDALSRIGGASDDVVPELSRRLRDSDPDVADRAALGLARYARFANEALPDLIDAIRVRELACEAWDAHAAALAAIDPQPAVLRQRLQGIDSEIRARIVQGLRTARERTPQTS